MFAMDETSRRHRKLMRSARHLLRQTDFSIARYPSGVTAQDVAAYAFGRYQLDVELDEAQRHLDAVRVARGESLPPVAST